MYICVRHGQVCIRKGYWYKMGKSLCPYSSYFSKKAFLLTALVCSPSVCHFVNHSVFQCLSWYVILLYNGFNINNYYIHYCKIVFAHKRYHYAYEFQCNKHFLLHVMSTQMHMRN